MKKILNLLGQENHMEEIDKKTRKHLKQKCRKNVKHCQQEHTRAKMRNGQQDQRYSANPANAKQLEDG